MERRKKRKGFTLIELMVVLAILGMLFALVGPGILRKLTGAKKEVVKTYLETIKGQLGYYQVTKKQYPKTLQALVDEKLIKRTLLKDPWGRKFIYRPRYSDDGDVVVGYTLFSSGPDMSPGTADDVYPEGDKKTAND